MKITPDFLNELRQKYATGPGETHYQDCYLNHPRCAINRLINLIEDLQENIVSLQEDVAIESKRVTELEDQIFLHDSRED